MIVSHAARLAKSGRADLAGAAPVETIVVMLIRQFSIRWLLLFTAVCAVVSLLVALSLDGNRWAAGVVTALASLLVVLVVHAVLFSLFWLATLAWPVDRRRGRPPVAPGRPSGTELAARGTTQ